MGLAGGVAGGCKLPSPQRIPSATPLAFHRHTARSRHNCAVVAQSVRIQADCRAEEPGLTLVRAALTTAGAIRKPACCAAPRGPTTAHRLMTATAEQIAALNC